jgi:hypothetical protein
MKKDKYNPDVEQKMKTKENERDETKFNLSNTIYNPITGVVPKEIKDNKDLLLNKDKTLSKIEFANLINQKYKERKNQSEQLKPVKATIINQNENHTTQNIKSFEELKNTSSQKQPVKNEYNNILAGLKELGIIK